jgi:hypothetical protein
MKKLMVLQATTINKTVIQEQLHLVRTSPKPRTMILREEKENLRMSKLGTIWMCTWQRKEKLLPI